MMVVLGSAKLYHLRNFKSFPTLLNVIKFGVIVQKDEMNNIFDFL